VRWPSAWELVRELQFSRCEPLLLEAGSCGRGVILKPRVRVMSAVRSHYRAMASRDCNRLRKLVCV
jgi:hypothetical protein